jgi:hypothetical protein
MSHFFCSFGVSNVTQWAVNSTVEHFTTQHGIKKNTLLEYELLYYIHNTGAMNGSILLTITAYLFYCTVHS